MWKRKKDRRRVDPAPLELCDLCARTFPEDEAVSGYVPDSSCAHPRRQWCDGLRRVTACSEEHFGKIREEYRLRPFIPEELWAAKVNCALTTGRPALTLEELGRRTGLHEPEIRRAIAWHNERLRHAGDNGVDDGTSTV